MRFFFALIIVAALPVVVWAQEPARPEVPADRQQEADPPPPEEGETEEEREERETRIVPDLTYEQHPGLAYAASKIYFTDQKYSVSGFGEFNVTPIAEGKNADSGDIELYYTGLYRFSTFFGYKLARRIIFNFEFLGEFLHDGTQEVGHDIVIEAMVDFLGNRYANLRVGYYPLPLAYINNNDEPVMFFSVNRPEVDRLIMPTAWIALGVMGFGSLPQRVSYSGGFVGGLNSSNFIGASWVRQGRQIHHGVPEDLAFVGKVEHSPARRFVYGVSGYHGGSSDGREVDGQEVRAVVSLGAVHAKYETENWRLLGVSSWGSLSDTEGIFALTGEVLGRQTFGYYVETGYDLLPLLGMHSARKKAPVFVRYERLNTHRRVATSLAAIPRAENDLRVITVGFNYNPQRSLVYKANYQFRRNFSRLEEGGRAEFGLGFVF